MAKKNQHIHRLERAIIGKNNYTVYRCNLPDCPYYIAERLAKGKITRCNRCDQPMTLDSRAMNLVKPHCVDCIKIKKKDNHDSILEFLKSADVQS